MLEFRTMTNIIAIFHIKLLAKHSNAIVGNAKSHIAIRHNMQSAGYSGLDANVQIHKNI